MPDIKPRRERPARHIMRPKQVCQALGWSLSTLYENIKTGEFPPFIKIGPRASGQDSNVVYDYMDKLLDEADA